MAKHNIDLVTLVPQVWVAWYYCHVLSESRDRKTRSNFADDVGKSVDDPYHWALLPSNTILVVVGAAAGYSSRKANRSGTIRRRSRSSSMNWVQDQLRPRPCTGSVQSIFCSPVFRSITGIFSPVSLFFLNTGNSSGWRKCLPSR